MSDEEWPPAAARARAALWESERWLSDREFAAAAAALEGAFACGDPATVAVARGLRHLAAAGYRHEAGEPERAQRQLARARVRLTPFLPVYEEVELEDLLDLVAALLRP